MTGNNPVVLLSNGGEGNRWCTLALDKFINIKRAESKNTKRKNLTEIKQAQPKITSK